MAATFHIENFGCRAARADGEAIADRLRTQGMLESADADVVIVNTCSVTAEADREARAFIRRTHRRNPEAKIVATGCYAQRAPQELAGLQGVAAVVGNSHKALAPEIVAGLAGTAPQGLKPEAFAETGDVRAEARTLQDRTLQARSLQEPVEGRNLPTPSQKNMRMNGAQTFVSVASLVDPSGAVVLADDSFAHSFLEEAQVAPGAQTRPNLKIQEGCGNRCSFCVIPQTRGGSRSLAADKVLRQVEGFVAAGGKELVFSGINLGRWGHEFSRGASGDRNGFSYSFAETNGMGARGGSESLGNWSPTHAENHRMDGAHRAGSLAGLVRQIFAETEVARLRLSSIEPMDWDAEMLALMAEFGGAGNGTRRLARHAHLPLQSGSDAVLRRMHRRYRPWHYAEKVAALVKAAGPELTLGADVMVGFPGETDAEFEETLEMVRALPFGYLHLFPFSPRPGTKAWALHAANPVAAEAVQERMAELRRLAGEKMRAHRERMIGQRLDAITLHTPAALQAQGRTLALTENFLPVEVNGQVTANELVSVRAMGLTEDSSLTAEFARSSSERGQAVAV